MMNPGKYLCNIGVQQFFFTGFNFIVGIITDIINSFFYKEEIRSNIFFTVYLRPILIISIYFVIGFFLYKFSF